MTGPITHCDTCESPHLATRPCQHCARQARVAGRRAEMERQRIALVERVKRTRKRRAKGRRERGLDAVSIATAMGAYDGERGLEPATEGRFRGHGGARAWRAYERAYREAR